MKKIIGKLDSKNGDGHNMISICMLKISGDAIIQLLFTIFKNCLKYGIFPDDQKKGNIVPIFNKGDKQNKKFIVQYLFSQSAANPNMQILFRCSIQFGGAEKVCAWDVLSLGVLKHFAPWEIF